LGVHGTKTDGSPSRQISQGDSVSSATVLRFKLIYPSAPSQPWWSA
jgi:hypothetical protein